MFNSGNISLMKVNSLTKPIKNLFGSIEYKRKEGHEYGDIILRDLEYGTYSLHFKKLELNITLTIHKGVYWESEDFILKKDKLVYFQQKKSLKRITDYTVDAEESKQDESLRTVSFKVDGASHDVKVHVFASNTIFADAHQFVMKYENFGSPGHPQNFLFNKNENQYMSNKKLGDELRYALERKYLKSFMGTNLEKPGLLFKKKYVADTYFTSAASNNEQNYQNVVQSRCQNIQNRVIPTSGYGYNK